MELKIKTVEKTDKKLILESNILWFAWLLLIGEIAAIVLGFCSIISFNTEMHRSCEQKKIVKKEFCDRFITADDRLLHLNVYLVRGLLIMLPLPIIVVFLISQIKNVKCEINKNLGDLKITRQSILKTTKESHPIADIIDINLQYRDNKLIAPIVLDLQSKQQVNLKFLVPEESEKIKALKQIQDFLELAK